MLRDLRHAGRVLRRAPAFTIAAATTLALGIALNTAVFSVANALLFRPLPYAAPDELTWIEARAPERGIGSRPLSGPDLYALRTELRSFGAVAAFHEMVHRVTGGAHAERVTGTHAAAHLLPMLGAQPLLGRHLSDAGVGDRSDEVVIGHALWQRRFGGDADVIGRTMQLDGRTRTIVGVMPAGFGFPERSELWTPLAIDPSGDRDAAVAYAIARRRPDVTPAAAAAEVSALSRRLAVAHPASNAGLIFAAPTLREYVTSDEVGSGLGLFQTMTLLVLLVACANVAGLQLARGEARRRELAIRAALGGARRRLLRELLAEGVLVALLGAVGGLLLGLWLRDMLLARVAFVLPFWFDASFDGRVGLAVAMAAGICLLVYAAVPVLRLWRLDIREGMAGGRVTTGPRTGRARGALVVGQLALSLLLLSAAGLMTKSYRALQGSDMGFAADGVATVELWLPTGSSATPDERRQRWQEIVHTAASVPGVERVGLSAWLPMSGGGFSGGLPVRIDGMPPGMDGRGLEAQYAVTDTGFLGAIGGRMLSGRWLEAADAPDAPRAVVVNAAAAEAFWPGMDPIGRRLQLGRRDDAPLLTVVGVVANQRPQAQEPHTPPVVYASSVQQPPSAMRLFVRTTADASALAIRLRDVLAASDPELLAERPNSMRENIAQAAWRRRMMAEVFGLMAVMAAALAAVGVYGTIAYGVRQRTRELAVRVALGARAGDVLRLVAAQGARLALIGLVLGALGTLAATRLLASLLYGVSPTDPPVLAIVALLLVTVAAIATLLPAYRATRVDPVVALREE